MEQLRDGLVPREVLLPDELSATRSAGQRYEASNALGAPRLVAMKRTVHETGAYDRRNAIIAKHVSEGGVAKVGKLHGPSAIR